MLPSHFAVAGATLLILSLGTPATPARDVAPSPAQQRMLEEIRDTVAHTQGYTGRAALSGAVAAAMASVPRHEFVPREVRELAYANRPLPIGFGQTISQPYIVALMTELAAVGPGDVVLEIGTGSGYQAAVLARVAGRVYSVEIVPELAQQARETLARLGYANVEVRTGDGYHGWPEHAPFDAIVVTAAPEDVPTPLLEQLRPGGRLVVPVGPRDRTQSLKLLHKRADGTIVAEDILPVGFVPLTGDH
jgi:protein-L-isoaspartate(D-aspartate) O-methyltransferase